MFHTQPLYTFFPPCVFHDRLSQYPHKDNDVPGFNPERLNYLQGLNLSASAGQKIAFSGENQRVNTVFTTAHNMRLLFTCSPHSIPVTH
jgi:hypothetical protein